MVVLQEPTHLILRIHKTNIVNYLKIFFIIRSSNGITRIVLYYILFLLPVYSVYYGWYIVWVCKGKVKTHLKSMQIKSNHQIQLLMSLEI